MKNISAKWAFLFLPLLGYFLFPACNIAVADQPDEVIIDQLEELYEPVIFDHLMHADIYDCSRCHHDGENDGQPGACSTCHSGRSFDGQQSCSACHIADISEQPEESAASQIPQYHIDTPTLKGSWHLLCRDCHVEEGVASGCQDCHAFTEKGQEFFKEK